MCLCLELRGGVSLGLKNINKIPHLNKRKKKKKETELKYILYNTILQSLEIFLVEINSTK